MNKSNIHLSGKALNIAIEALEYRMRVMRELLCNENATDEQFANIDYGNDIQILEGIKKIFLEQCNYQNTDNQANKYVIAKSDNGISLHNYEQQTPIDDKEVILFIFEANSFNEAMAIRNKFLDFEPYVPMSENIVATRMLTLFDKSKNPKSEVEVLVYQPVKAQENEWHCEYYINVYNAKKTSCKNMGGRKVVGYDTMQAVLRTFLIIDSILIVYNEEEEEQIYWLEYGKDWKFI